MACVNADKIAVWLSIFISSIVPSVSIQFRDTEKSMISNLMGQQIYRKINEEVSR